MITGILFTVLWRTSGVVLLPILLLYKKSRPHIWRVPTPTPGRTWIHGASIGEHRIAEAIVPHLGPVWRTHSSWRSRPKGTFPAPMDIPFIIGPWLDRARPGRLILLEGELWPGWLIECRKRRIPVVVLAARKGPGWNRWQMIRRTFAWLTRGVGWMYADDIGDLKQMNPVPKAPFDIPPTTIVGVSTRDGDELRIIRAWEELSQPRPKLILAPRHIQRMDSIETQTGNHSTSRRSTGLNRAADIWLIDTHGELPGILSEAHIAVIGGTFHASIGGHSPSEAVTGGAHIVHGPHTHSNTVAWKDVESSEANTASELASIFRRLLHINRPGTRTHAIDMASIITALPKPIYTEERTGCSLLWPLVPPWNLLSRVTRRLQGLSNKKGFVVVGGLVNGGAGRTPVTAWLADNIEHSRVLSRGYKRSEFGSDIRLGTPTDPATTRLGDELEMIRRRGHTVMSAPNRIAGLAQCTPGTIPIFDGGLGDPRLKGGYRIACIDAYSPRGGGPFPVGRRRLPWKMLNEVDAIWVSNALRTEELRDLPHHIPVVRSQLEPISWIHKGREYPLDSVHGEIDVVVGIANPARFICTLLDLDLTIRSVRTVSDHAPLGTLPPAAVLTEKDAARIPVDSDVWALRMELVVVGAETVLAQIREHCQ